MYKCLQLGFI